MRRHMLLCAAGGTVLVVLVAVGITFTRGRGSPVLVQLSSTPLGTNVAPWDSYATSSSAHGGLGVLQAWLRAAGIRQLRYGGGSYADTYNWQTNTSIRSCLPGDPAASFVSDCASSGSLSFTQFSRQAKAVSAESFVTVNYGSGTPAEAAAWVAEAKETSKYSVALWEIGNESYGCWEVNKELGGAPEYYEGYKPSLSDSGSAGANEQTCPQVREGDPAGTQTLATSYAVNAQRFLLAMKAADPSVRIGVPWAFGPNVHGAYVPDSSEWNDSVLRVDGKYVNFVDAHYYPFNFYGSPGGGNPTTSEVLQSLTKIPSLYASIRAALNTFDPDASVVVGETAVSNRETTTTCSPVGAVFAAGDVLSWLAAGAESVDWWYMNDGGNTTPTCDSPGSGLFTSSSSPTPESPYYGYLLASLLAQPRARLAKIVTTAPHEVLGFEAILPDGKHAEAFINLNARSPEKVAQPSDGMSGTLKMWRYDASKQNVGNPKIATETLPAASVADGVWMPAESIVVLESQ